MRIATVATALGARAAVAVESGELLIPSLAADLDGATGLPPSVREILLLPDGLAQLGRVQALADGADQKTRDRLGAVGALLSENDVTFCAPVPDPINFVGCGASYHQHLREMGGVPVPAHPVIFLCSPGSISGHRRPIIVPARQPDMIDYEGELALVIGKPCYGVGVEQALDAVAGYLAHNDVSARDHVAEVKAVTVPTQMLDAWGRNCAGKQHPTFSPMGPYLVTSDEVPDPAALRLTTRVNGDVVQDIGIDDLIFSVAEYVSYVAQWHDLQPGDIISTGTPGGVGIARQPPVFLKPGDRVDVTVTKLGTLSNTVELAT